jgi:hypothetical protein
MHKIICNDSERFIRDLPILPFHLDIILRPLGYNNLSYELLAVFLLIHEEGTSSQFLRSENERGWFRRRQWFDPINEHASINGHCRMFGHFFGHNIMIEHVSMFGLYMGPIFEGTILMDVTLPSRLKTREGSGSTLVPLFDMPALLDVPASLHRLIMALSFRIPLLIELSPPDMQAQKLPSSEVVECNKD